MLLTELLFSILPTNTWMQFHAYGELFLLAVSAGILYVLLRRHRNANLQAERQLSLQVTALEAAANAIVITDRNGVIEWVNPAFSVLTGYSREESVGLGMRDLLNSGTHDPFFYKDMWDTILRGETWYGELTNRRKDGSRYTEEQRITSVRGPDGTISHFIAVKQDITERKRAEKALRINEYAIHSANAIAMAGLDGNLNYVNPAFLKMWGFDDESEVLGRASVDFWNTREHAEAIVAALHDTGSWFGELTARRKDGSSFHVQISANMVLGENSQPLCMQAWFVDITERKERERELQLISSANAALRPAITRAQIVPTILDQLSALLAVDGAMLETLDPTSGNILVELGQGIWSSITGRFVPARMGLTAHVLDTGQPYLNNAVHLDPRLLDSDLFGECRSAACAPVILENQMVGLLWIGGSSQLSEHDLHLLTIVADIAASAIRRGDLYDQTQSQAEQINQLLRSVPDGVLLLDEGLRLVQTNPAGKEYLARLANIQVGDFLQRMGNRPLDDLLTSPTPGTWHEIRHAQHVFETLARPLVTGPTMKGWVFVLRDVTRQREIQEQLQRQERLAAVGQLAAGIAHDFNNLMGVIVLYAELLSHVPGLSDKNQERLNIIYQQARQASNLIEQILDFSRRSVMEKQPLNLKPLLKEQVKLLQRTLPENVDINLTADDADHTILADPTRIQQILMNLAINARDAMPTGGQLHIDLALIAIAPGTPQPLPGVGPGHWVRITVSDTGVGIPPEVIGHIFEPFFTTKGSGKGTGLGLAQVYGIVGQHGGQIGVESQVGQATIFTIYFPALVDTGDNIANSPQALPQGQGELLLVVEDNESLLSALAEYLQIWNYRSTTASNGEEALRLLTAQGEIPDLILSDMVMPRMGGAAFLDAVRRWGFTMPVIMVSGHPLDETELSPLTDKGMVAWLPKPLDMSELACTIARALNGKMVHP